MMVVAITLCSVSPLITLVGIVYLFFSRLSHSYLCVFAETRKADLGGVFWVAQLRHLSQGLLIYILLMTSILMERSKRSSLCFRSWCTWELPWEAIVAASTLVYWVAWNHRFQHTLQWETLSFEKVVDGGSAAAASRGSKERAQGGRAA